MNAEGHHFTEGDFQSISYEHPDAKARMKDIDEYFHMLLAIGKSFL